MDSAKEFGTAIRTRRKELSLTQKELAMACGTGLRFIVDLENGKPTCQFGKAIRVLQSLGLSIQLEPLEGKSSQGRRP